MDIEIACQYIIPIVITLPLFEELFVCLVKEERNHLTAVLVFHTGEPLSQQPEGMFQSSRQKRTPGFSGSAR